MVAERAPVAVKGCYRVHIVDPDGTIAGDSGWHENQVVNLGFNQYLVLSLMGDAAGKTVSHVAIGTGTVPGAAATSLDGEFTEVSSRAAVTTATSSTSKRARFTATFASQSSFVTKTESIRNIGLFNTSTRTTGTIFAGNTYASSTCATNQNVNIWRHLLATVGSKLRKFGEHLSAIIQETIPSQAPVMALGKV